MGEPVPFRRGDDYGRDGDRFRGDRGHHDGRGGYDRDGDSFRGRDAHRRGYDEDRGGRRVDRSPSPLPDFGNRSIRWSGWDKPVPRFGNVGVAPSPHMGGGGYEMDPRSESDAQHFARASAPMGPGPGANLASASAVPRQQKRLYVGNLPPLVEAHFVDFLNAAMKKVPGAVLGEGNPIIGIDMSNERTYCFIELRSADEATFFTAFDGITYNGHSLRIHRPREWQPTGNEPPLPVVPQSALGIISTTVPDGPNKIFIGGLPAHFNEAEVKEILTAIGPLKAFNLVRDAGGNSKGFAFCEYVDPELTDLVCQSFNGRRYGDRTLVVQRSQPGQKGSLPPSGPHSHNPADSAPGQHPQHMDDRGPLSRGPDASSTASGQQILPQIVSTADGVSVLAAHELDTEKEPNALFNHLLNTLIPTEVLTNTIVQKAKEHAELHLQPTPIIAILNAVDTTEEWSDDYYNAVCMDMWNEGSKYGEILNLVVPRAPPKPPKKKIYAMPGELSDADIGAEGRKLRDAEPPPPPPPPGHGRVYIQYGSVDHAHAALTAMAGRKYDGRMLLSSFVHSLPEAAAPPPPPPPPTAN